MSDLYFGTKYREQLPTMKIDGLYRWQKVVLKLTGVKLVSRLIQFALLLGTAGKQ